MENWTLHWLSASGTLAPWSETIEREIASAHARIEQHVKAPRLDVLLRRGGNVIPEIGMAGMAYSPILFSIDFDPGKKHFDTCLTDGTLQRQVAHEVHHCMRFAASGYNTNLGEALVNEGLAGHFARLLYDNPPEPWEAALPHDKAIEFLPDGEQLRSPTYDHKAWFFGVGGHYPRWLGYTLGYAIVAKWIAESQPGVDEMINVDAGAVLALANGT